MNLMPLRHTYAEHGDSRADYDWPNTYGVVYLMRCVLTNDYKVGATLNPAIRLPQLKIQARKQYGRELVYVWYIITNGIGRLENHFAKSWSRYRVAGMSREWFKLPESEVRVFRLCSVLNWRDLDPVSPEVRDLLTQPHLPSVEHLAVFNPAWRPTKRRNRRR